MELQALPHKWVVFLSVFMPLQYKVMTELSSINATLKQKSNLLQGQVATKERSFEVESLKER